MRFQAFKANLEKIAKHNSDDQAFKMGINKFSDLSEEEFLAIYGTLKEHEE